MRTTVKYYDQVWGGGFLPYYHAPEEAEINLDACVMTKKFMGRVGDWENETEWTRVYGTEYLLPTGKWIVVLRVVQNG